MHRIFWSILTVTSFLGCSGTFAASENTNTAIWSACGANGYSPGMPTDTNFLYRSANRFDGPSVGILKVTEDGRAVLNPLKPYPPSVKLKGLTFDEATKLWGTPSTQPDTKNSATFDLWGFWVVDKSKKAEYHIDAKFVNKILMSYQIRGAGLISVWTDVE